MKNIRKFVVLSLCVTVFGISNFVTPVGATAQIPIVSPSNAVIHNGKGKVMILAEVIRAAKRLLGFIPQLDVPKELHFIFTVNGKHPAKILKLSDKALD